MSTSPSPEQDVFAFRKLARRRAWICPGAGFALIGWKWLGRISYFSGLAALLGAAATAIYPSAALFQATLAAVVVATLLWIVEIIATLNAWPPGDSAVAGSRRYVTGAVVLMLAAAAFGAAMFFSFRLIEIQGQGMAPVVWNGDRLLYHRRVDPAQLQRGAVVLFELPPENNFTEAGTLMLGRIMAVPGDKISLANFRYRVNDSLENPTPPETELPIALNVPRAPQTITVPPDCYFITQDDRETGLDSQVVGWAKLDRIVSTSLFQVQRRPLLARVQ
ncbi:MAG: signal peptidase I [Pirellula sp.]|nr:signal peptidase I [Pirellula sp.]